MQLLFKYGKHNPFSGYTACRAAASSRFRPSSGARRAAERRRPGCGSSGPACDRSSRGAAAPSGRRRTRRPAARRAAPHPAPRRAPSQTPPASAGPGAPPRWRVSRGASQLAMRSSQDNPRRSPHRVCQGLPYGPRRTCAAARLTPSLNSIR